MVALLVGSRHHRQQCPTSAIVSTKCSPPSRCPTPPFLDLSPHPPLLPFSFLLTPPNKTTIPRESERERKGIERESVAVWKMGLVYRVEWNRCEVSLILHVSRAVTFDALKVTQNWVVIILGTPDLLRVKLQHIWIISGRGWVTQWSSQRLIGCLLSTGKITFRFWSDYAQRASLGSELQINAHTPRYVASTLPSAPIVARDEVWGGLYVKSVCQHCWRNEFIYWDRLRSAPFSELLS